MELGRPRHVDEDTPLLSGREWVIIGLSVLMVLNGWYILGIITVNILILLILEKKGFLDRWNATRVLGFILMIRTKRGQVTLEKISRPRRLWRWFGEFSLWLCAFIVLILAAVFILGFLAFISQPTPQPIDADVVDLLLIPGVSNGIPLVWPLVALVIALVIHEYGHGIQMRAHGMRVRSFGLLIASMIPIGAFAEPEAKEISQAPIRERMRTYAAGPAVNIVLATFLTFALASTMMSVEPHNQGAYSPAIVLEGPAEAAGLRPYDIIVNVENTSIESAADLQNLLSLANANDVWSMTVQPYNNQSKSWGDSVEMEIILADKHAHYLALNYTPEMLDAIGVQPGDPFMGVSSDGLGDAIRSTTGGRDRLIGPFATDLSTTERVFYGLAHPIQLVTTPLTFDGEIMAPAEAAMLDVNSIHQEIINGIFWLFWFNFLLGFLNLIPVVPFDGGHLMRDGIRGSIQSVSNRISALHPQRVEIFANKTANIASLLFVGIFALPILFRLII